MTACTCVTFQTIEAAKSTGRLEDLCRWYASEIDRLQPAAVVGGVPRDEHERIVAVLNRRIVKQNLELENLRKKAKT